MKLLGHPGFFFILLAHFFCCNHWVTAVLNFSSQCLVYRIYISLAANPALAFGIVAIFNAMFLESFQIKTNTDSTILLLFVKNMKI